MPEEGNANVVFLDGQAGEKDLPLVASEKENIDSFATAAITWKSANAAGRFSLCVNLAVYKQPDARISGRAAR